jgi:hypothetical protein
MARIPNLRDITALAAGTAADGDDPGRLWMIDLKHATKADGSTGAGPRGTGSFTTSRRRR